MSETCPNCNEDTLSRIFSNLSFKSGSFKCFECKCNGTFEVIDGETKYTINGVAA